MKRLARRNDGTPNRATRFLQHVLAARSVVILVMMVVVGVWQNLPLLGEEAEDERKCLAPTIRTLLTTEGNDCVAKLGSKAALPLAVDVLTLTGAAAALFMVMLHVRLSRMIDHFPSSTTARQVARNGERHDNLATGVTVARSLFRGRLVYRDVRGIGVFWALALQAGSFGASVGLYVLYAWHGNAFVRSCGSLNGAHLATCRDALKTHWWAYWRHDLPTAAAWVFVLGVALSLGVENFLMTNSLRTTLRRCLLDGGTPLRYIPNLAKVPTSWTLVQGVLTEMRLGFAPVTLSLLVIFGLVDGIQLSKSETTTEAVMVVAIVIIGAYFFHRLNDFRRTVETAAAKSLALIIAAMGTLGGGATSPQENELAALERATLLADRVTLPPLRADERLKVYFGYVFGALTLILAAIPVVRS